MSHVTHMNESYHTYEFVVKHIQGLCCIPACMMYVNNACVYVFYSHVKEQNTKLSRKSFVLLSNTKLSRIRVLRESKTQSSHETQSSHAYMFCARAKHKALTRHKALRDTVSESFVCLCLGLRLSLRLCLCRVLCLCP